MNDLIGTASYSSGWVVLALVLLAAVLLWNGGLLVWGRPRAVRPAAPPRVDRDGLRARSLTRIDELVAARAAGRITVRDAHRELSSVTRGFVQDATGIPTSAMTLTDLRSRDMPDLVDVIALVYPPEFGPDDGRSDAEWGEAVARARRVVDAPWN